MNSSDIFWITLIFQRSCNSSKWPEHASQSTSTITPTWTVMVSPLIIDRIHIFQMESMFRDPESVDWLGKVPRAVQEALTYHIILLYMCETSETAFWLLTSVVGMMWNRTLSIHSIRPCIGIELINDEFRYFHIFKIRKVSIGWNALSECVPRTQFSLTSECWHLTCRSGGCDGSVISGVFQCSWQVFLLFPLVYWPKNAIPMKLSGFPGFVYHLPMPYPQYFELVGLRPI